MLAALLGWLPIIGPIIQGITSVFTHAQDNELEKFKVETSTEVAEAGISRDIIKDTQDDILLRFMRDLMIFPVVVWFFLLCWDTIIAESTWVNHDYWMWHLASFQKTGAPFLPYAVLVFLLGNIGINTWKRSK